jgi:hypothetical protein
MPMRLSIPSGKRSIFLPDFHPAQRESAARARAEVTQFPDTL